MRYSLTLFLFIINLLTVGFAQNVKDQTKPFEWGNDHVVFRFDTAGGFDLIGIKDKSTGREIIDVDRQSRTSANLWEISLVDAEQSQIAVNNHSDASIDTKTTEQNGEKCITIRWRNICDSEGEPRANVVVTGTLPNASAIAQWHIKVEALPPYYVWSAQFPNVNGITDLGDDYMILPDALGRIVWDPTKRLSSRTLSYPGFFSMQFLAAWGSEQLHLSPPEKENFEVKGWSRGTAPDETGIYLAIYDPNGWNKVAKVRRDYKRESYGWQILNLPAYSQWPLQPSTESHSFDIPYPFALGVFNGTAETACDIYRNWSLKQQWAERGPIWEPNPEARFPLSKLIRDTVFWGKFYHEPGKVVPELADYSQYLRVPISTHYYRYYIAEFDNNNPEYVPLDPYFRRGIDDLRAAGVTTMPYINGLLWDMDTESWYKENAKASAVKSGDGHPAVISFTRGNIMGVMNTAAPAWQDKLTEIADKLVVKYGVDGLYLDQLATETRRSYSPDLGAVHGGNYWAKGFQTISEKLYEKMRSSRPEAFLTGESFCDAYLGSYDAFLTLDVLRLGWKDLNGYDVYPLMGMVYHDYTINFGGDMVPNHDPDFFSWQLGLAFTWGSQLMYSTMSLPKSSSYPITNGYLQEAVRAFHQVSKKFLTGGRWIQCALVPDKKLAGNAPVSVVSPEHTVTYSYKSRSFPWRGPSVLASAWKAYDNTLGVVLTNITGEKKEATVKIDAATLGLVGESMWNLWPLPVASFGKIDTDIKTIKLTLPPRSVRVFQIGGETAPQPLPLKENDWVLCTANEKGEFDTQIVEGSNLWGCVDTAVSNDLTNNNKLALLNANESQPRKLQTVVKWNGSKEGHGLPRAPEDKSFYLLQRTPYIITVDAIGKVNALDSLMYTELKTKNAGALTGPDNSIFFTLDKKAKLIRSHGELKLSSGQHTVVALSLEDLTSQEVPGTASVDKALDSLKDSSDILSAISQFSLSVLEFVQNPDSAPQTTARMQLEDRLTTAARNLTLLATGISGQIKMNQDWLSPVLPLNLEYQLNIAEEKTGKLIKFDFVSRDKHLTKGINIKAPNVANNTILTDESPLNLEYEISTPDDSLVERLLPFQIQAVVESAGKKFGLPISGWVTIDRPLTFKCKTTQVDAILGRPFYVKFQINNISPYDINTEIELELPKGWKAGKDNLQKISIASCDTKEIELALIPATNETATSKTINCFVKYGGKDSTRIIEHFKVSLLPNFEPITQANMPSPNSWQKFRGRRKQKILLYAEKGETIEAAIKADRLRGTTLYTLRGPDLTVLTEGKIESGEKVQVIATALETGNHYLEVRSSSVRGGNTWRLSVISPSQGGFISPLTLFASAGPLYAFVPIGAKEFNIAMSIGGPTEPAGLEIIRPDGVTVFKEYGNWNNVWLPIEVPEGMDGQIWKINLSPAEDMTCRVSGDIVPCLSPTPSGVLKLIGQDSSRICPATITF